MKQQELQYQEYVSRMVRVRRLSTPSLDGIPDADSYSERLKENFIEIGDLARQNRSFLSSVLFPLIEQEDQLSSDIMEALIQFGHELIDADTAENLDLPIMSLVSERLLKEAQQKNELSSLIQRLDARLDTYYALMNMTQRVSSKPEIADYFRTRGIEIGNYFLSLLDKDTFTHLPDNDSKETVLTDCRYIPVFFEQVPADGTGGGQDLKILERMLEIADDSFYHSEVPDYNWKFFRYRVLHYYQKSTDYHNHRGFSDQTLQRIADLSEDYWDLWHSDPEYFSLFDLEDQLRMVITRNRYLAGRLPKQTYRDLLIELYQRRDQNNYDLNGIYENLLIPSEYLSLVHKTKLDTEDENILQQFYQDVMLYAFRMPNSGSLSSMLEYCSNIMDLFIEVPGGITYQNMILNMMAALHPPTYIHSQMVAEITVCLTKAALRVCPEQLIGIFGTNKDEVLENQDAILDYAYNAALCHDFGKLAIIDTVLVYGRNLLDIEFDLIKTHPYTGSLMLKRYDSIKDYADVALGHHISYNGQKGYPNDFDPSASEYKAFIDLVRVADCMDAATDTVGRSYNQGKTLKAVVDEFRAGSGTQYAPWVTALFDETDLLVQLHDVLDSGRRKKYRETYHLLKNMHEGHE